MDLLYTTYSVLGGWAMFWNIFFYAVIAVGGLLFLGLLYYRIDWARHPEKYKDLEESGSNENKGKEVSSKKTKSKKNKKK